ncbi:MAG: S41 family peptidase [Anaerovorax sp.]
MLKKRNFILVIILAILIGMGTSAVGFYFVGLVQERTTMEISKAAYEQYQRMNQRYGKVDQLWNYVNEKYYIPVDQEKLKEGIYKGLFWGIGDPYSSYLTPEEYEKMMISTTGEYSGVGVTIAADPSGYITVVSTMPGSPAEKAGVKFKDLIVAIDGKKYDNTTLDEAATALRGPSGSQVKVILLRDEKRKEVTITRGKIVVDTVEAKTLDGNVGYIKISAFEENTAKEFENELRNFEVHKVEGLVIDLRYNGGGLVDVGIEIADMLLPAGLVAYTEDRQGNKSTYKSKEGETNLPYVLLVNGGTASTSEILAAAVKDHKTAQLVGTTTFGKGIIQSVEKQKDGSALKLTVMQYFSPNGNVIHGVGIEPDIVVKELKVKEGQDPNELQDIQLEKALEVLKKK